MDYDGGGDLLVGFGGRSHSESDFSSVRDEEDDDNIVDNIGRPQDFRPTNSNDNKTGFIRNWPGRVRLANPMKKNPNTKSQREKDDNSIISNLSNAFSRRTSKSILGKKNRRKSQTTTRLGRSSRRKSSVRKRSKISGARRSQLSRFSSDAEDSTGVSVFDLRMKLKDKLSSRFLNVSEEEEKSSKSPPPVIFLGGESNSCNDIAADSPTAKSAMHIVSRNNDHTLTDTNFMQEFKSSDSIPPSKKFMQSPDNNFSAPAEASVMNGNRLSPSNRLSKNRPRMGSIIEIKEGQGSSSSLTNGHSNYHPLEKKIETNEQQGKLSHSSDQNADSPRLRKATNYKLRQQQKVQRQAVVNQRVQGLYEKKVVPKSPRIRQNIRNAISQSILFQMWSDQELDEFIDTFEQLNFKPGSIIIREGDEGNYFYVIESGIVDVMKDMNKVAEINEGGSFGEIALLYNTPRNATVKANSKCKLWFIHRKDYHGVSRLTNEKKHGNKIEFLKKVKIGAHILGDVLESSEIYNIALATRSVHYSQGECIVKEGEKGNTFYIIKSGTVDVFISSLDQPIITMCRGQFFGEKALLSEEGLRTATCIAGSNVVCFCLFREDFLKMMGDVGWLLQESYPTSQNKSVISETESEAFRRSSREKIYGQRKALSVKMSDLEIIRTIGVGSFGRVKLVRIKPSARKHHNDSGETLYALKCLNMKRIMENQLVDLLMYEKTIMEQLSHPFIINFYVEMSTPNHTNFLLEYLPGGELFRLLCEEEQFPENWGRFYAGIVLLALEDMHKLKIAYRDLKPENLVLDAKGYSKIIDFGLAKKIDGKTWTLCGTPDYMPPEVILNEGHDWAVDYWGLGILLYEFTEGVPPFTSEFPMDVYKKILSGDFSIPSHFSTSIVDLIKKLLNPSQSTRLGRTFGGAKEIKKHEWFSELDFKELIEQGIEAPSVPVLKSIDDTSYFDPISDDEEDEEYLNMMEDIDEEIEEDDDQLHSLPGSKTGLMRKEGSSTSFGSSSTSEKQNVVRFSVESEDAFENKNRKLSRKKSYAVGKRNRHHEKLTQFVQQQKEANSHNDYTPTMDSRASSSQPSVGTSSDEFKSQITRSINQTSYKTMRSNSKFSQSMNADAIRGRGADSYLMIQLMNLTLAEQKESQSGEKKTETFNQFSLLSVEPIKLLQILAAYGDDDSSIIDYGKRYLDPLFIHSIDVIDQFPSSNSSQKLKNQVVDPGTLSVFCFPDGLSVRLLPRCAVAGAKKVRWLGKDSDHYQLHAFTNASGDRRHGVTITTREEIFCSEGELDSIVSHLKVYREKRRAALIIARCWKRYCQRTYIRHDEPEENTKNVLGFPRKKLSNAPNVVSNSIQNGYFGFLNKGSSSKNDVEHNNSNRSLQNNQSSSSSATPQIEIKTSNNVVNILQTSLMRHVSNPFMQNNSQHNNSNSQLQKKYKTEKSNNSHNNNSNSSRRVDFSVSGKQLSHGDSFAPNLETVGENGAHHSTSSRSKATITVKRLAAESYNNMIQNDRAGEICVIEKCYVLIGMDSSEQSLHLNALQKLIDVEREDNAIRQVFSRASATFRRTLTPPSCGIGNDSSQRNSLLAQNRSSILQALQSKLRMSSDKLKQSTIPTASVKSGKKNSKSVAKNSIEIDLGVGHSSKISLPIPLPDISGQWGLSTLCRSIKVTNLLIVLKLLLMERSILLIGTSGEKVSTASCALLSLLEPYKWASAFIPILPDTMIDIVGSPVPLIAGVVARNYVCQKKLIEDPRVKNAIKEGMSVIDLDNKKFILTTEKIANDSMRRCHNPIMHELLFNQQQLEILTCDPSSSLNSFKSFFMSGGSVGEIKVLQTITDSIRTHLCSLSGVLSERPDGYKEFGSFVNDEFEFYPDKFLEPLRAQLAFQEQMASTQLFLSYIEEKKCRHLLLTGPEAQFIADWVYFRRKQRSRNKSISFNRPNILGVLKTKATLS